MPWLVQKIVIWTFLCLAYIGAETDVCNLGDCRGREGRSIQQKKILRKLLRKNGAVLSSNAVLSSTEGRTRCLARTAIQPGDLLFEIPLSISLWRGTVTLPNLPRNSRLSDIDKLVLYLALLIKDFLLNEDSFKSKSTPLVAYAGQLLLEGAPNATILWPQEALSWLVGTEAQEVTEHLLRRVSMIHAAAPLEVDYQDVKVTWFGICIYIYVYWFDARVDGIGQWNNDHSSFIHVVSDTILCNLYCTDIHRNWELVDWSNWGGLRSFLCPTSQITWQEAEQRSTKAIESQQFPAETIYRFTARSHTAEAWAQTFSTKLPPPQNGTLENSCWAWIRLDVQASWYWLVSSKGSFCYKTGIPSMYQTWRLGASKLFKRMPGAVARTASGVSLGCVVESDRRISIRWIV